ncbi:MAG TPA: response regulator [Mariprofundaceae bacterium]|nr:response regulator [Mariprofundaceae bacterium]
MAKVLVVDDNPLNIELAADVLELDGFEVVLAESGEEGVARALESSPDLVLMDMRMPGMSGLDAMQELRRHEQTRDIPVVVLTASAMKGDRERLLREGFDGYLEKPIDFNTFTDSVRDFLQGERESV